MEQSPKITEFANNIAARQYFHKDSYGTPTEDYPGMLRRVARHVARAEAIDAYKKDNGRYPEWYISYEGRKKTVTDLKAFDAWITEHGYADLVKTWEDKFYTLMIEQRFSPGGRILAGAESPYGQLQNCFVLGPSGRYITKAKGDADSIDGIYELSYKLAKVTKTGGGCGLNLDFMRESGSGVKGSGGQSSGPVSFLRLNYNTTLRVIRLEGVRRGAGMATMSINHPDILDFITAKDLDREEKEGKIDAFNLSILVTDDFMEKVARDEVHEFISVATPGKIVLPSPVLGKYHLPTQLPSNVESNPDAPATSRRIPIVDKTDDSGNEILGVSARWLWNEILVHAWQTGDPGVIFVDRINQYWPLLDYLGPLNATNPCGEEPLFPGESCCLGSMILSSYAKDGQFDMEAFERDVPVAIRFLDNVLTVNAHPLEDTQEWCDRLRRVGLGVMGDAVMLLKLGKGYDSPEAMEMRNTLGSKMRTLAVKASEDLAKEKGAFPLVEHTDLVPRRNVHVLSIAPTGTISMVADTSSGIEPIYALAMQRRVGTEYQYRLDPTFEKYLVEHRPEIDLSDPTQMGMYEVPVGYSSSGAPRYAKREVHSLIHAILQNNGSIHGLEGFSEEEQALFKTAHDVTPSGHVSAQAAWQQAMDSPEMGMASISKTVNMPNTATVEEVRQVYEQGYAQGLKGITIYRDGSRADQVLRTDSRETDSPKEEAPTPEASPLPETTMASQIVPRPRRTVGEMTKAEFRDANGRERKVYVYVGCDDINYPLEVFVTDEEGGYDIHPYATALGKVISMALKHGTPPEKIAKKLMGISGGSVSFSGGVYQSVPDMIGKLLSESVENMWTLLADDEEDEDEEYSASVTEEPLGAELPNCDRDKNCPMTSQGGCKVCQHCGYSKCM